MSTVTDNKEELREQVKNEIMTCLGNTHSIVDIQDRTELLDQLLALIEQQEQDAFKRGQLVGQYQAADKMYGSITQMWLFKDDVSPVLNDPDRATNLLNDCEKYMNHNRKAYEVYLKALSQPKDNKEEV